MRQNGRGRVVTDRAMEWVTERAREWLTEWAREWVTEWAREWVTELVRVGDGMGEGSSDGMYSGVREFGRLGEGGGVREGGSVEVWGCGNAGVRSEAKCGVRRVLRRRC